MSVFLARRDFPASWNSLRSAEKKSPSSGYFRLSFSMGQGSFWLGARMRATLFLPLEGMPWKPRWWRAFSEISPARTLETIWEKTIRRAAAIPTTRSSKSAFLIVPWNRAIHSTKGLRPLAEELKITLLPRFKTSECLLFGVFTCVSGLLKIVPGRVG